jgi:hypothetical protein
MQAITSFTTSDIARFLSCPLAAGSEQGIGTQPASVHGEHLVLDPSTEKLEQLKLGEVSIIADIDHRKNQRRLVRPRAGLEGEDRRAEAFKVYRTVSLHLPANQQGEGGMQGPREFGSSRLGARRAGR